MFDTCAYMLYFVESAGHPTLCESLDPCVNDYTGCKGICVGMGMKHFTSFCKESNPAPLCCCIEI